MAGQSWKPHLWALVIPIALTALAYAVGIVLLYFPAIVSRLAGRLQ